jgi:hypothetical protein
MLSGARGRLGSVRHRGEGSRGQWKRELGWGGFVRADYFLVLFVLFVLLLYVLIAFTIAAILLVLFVSLLTALATAAATASPIHLLLQHQPDMLTLSLPFSSTSLHCHLRHGPIYAAFLFHFRSILSSIIVALHLKYLTVATSCGLV